MNIKQNLERTVKNLKPNLPDRDMFGIFRQVSLDEYLAETIVIVIVYSVSSWYHRMSKSKILGILFADDCHPGVASKKEAKQVPTGDRIPVVDLKALIHYEEERC